jgi:futalosine hydrolase
VRILIVAATPLEIAPLVAQLGPATARGARVEGYASEGRAVDVLVTGIGMVPAAAWCARTLAQGAYDVALNFGLCGSFDAAFAPGDVVHVVQDRVAELGAEDGDLFRSFAELGLPAEDQVVNRTPPASPALAVLRRVRGITVSTVHGNEASIAAAVDRFAPEVESMEGAAFMYACTISGIPYAQVRAVSNVVERRNRTAWKMDEAVERLALAALEIVRSL